MVTRVECPVCSETSGDRECASCGVDLTILFETRRVAYQLANQTLKLAREGRITRAADRAAQGMQLYLDEELRELFGWILFLDGRFRLAGICWTSVPERVGVLLTAYREALESAREAAWEGALEVLEGVDVPFRHAVLLRLICAERAGAESQLREASQTLAVGFPDIGLAPRESQRNQVRTAPDPSPGRSWRPASIVGVGAMLLLAGAGLGYGIERATSEKFADSQPTPAVDPAPNATEEGAGPSPQRAVADSLRFAWAYVRQDPEPVARTMNGTLDRGPTHQVQRIPEQVRYQTARGWYLNGLRLVESGRSDQAVQPLQAALASVGAASDLYWVDDALYLLARAVADSSETEAATIARALLANHASSMYANSVTRSLAAESREGVP